ncbi:MAG: phage head protein [Rhodobacteraceae bacterium]|nr:phage head protein [Paracoccaceae bacterium]|tara:strand:+ start:255 stop:1211 length:957 start_codon:yes stop_codon:yes gene_type:complete
MGVPTNTRETYGAIGIREDLSNIIYNISPEETPFMSNIGKSSCDNTYFEWQTDALASASTSNRVAEGDDASALAVAEPTRRGNYTQISTKAIQTSGTAEAVDFAGRKSTEAYQMAKRAKELKLDMEAMLLTNNGMVAGSSGTARETGSVGAWIQSNLENGTAAASSAFGTTPPTAGSDKAVVEADIKDLMKKCWDAGASPSVIMVDGALKQKISTLSQSVSELRTSANDKSPAYVVAAVDIYVSDFGNLQIVPNRHMPAKTCYFLDYEYWDIAYLRPFNTFDLARTGDSMAKQLVVEYGLRARNEAANGAILGWDPAL